MTASVSDANYNRFSGVNSSQPDSFPLGSSMEHFMRDLPDAYAIEAVQGMNRDEPSTPPLPVEMEEQETFNTPPESPRLPRHVSNVDMNNAWGLSNTPVREASLARKRPSPDSKKAEQSRKRSALIEPSIVCDETRAIYDPMEHGYLGRQSSRQSMNGLQPQLRASYGNGITSANTSFGTIFDPLVASQGNSEGTSFRTDATSASFMHPESFPNGTDVQQHNSETTRYMHESLNNEVANASSQDLPSRPRDTRKDPLAKGSVEEVLLTNSPLGMSRKDM